MTTTDPDAPEPPTSPEPPTAPSEHRPVVDAPVEGVAPVVRRPRQQAAASPGRSRRRGRRRTTGWWIAATVLFLAALGALGFIGYRSSLKITGGTPAVTDPAAPGYVAEVEPTPVQLLAIQDAAGKLAAALIVVTDAGGTGGTVISVPAQLFMPAVDAAPQANLADIYAGGGIESLRNRLGTGLGFGFTDAANVPATEVAALAGLIGPITFENFENLSPAPKLTDPPTDPAADAVTYRAGQVTLPPEQIVDFIGFEGRGELVDNRGIRQQEVWKTLVDGLKGKNGPATGALGAAFAAVSAGDVRFEQLPVATKPEPNSIFVVTVPDAAAMPAFTARTIAAPVAAYPGQRARTRILNGTSSPASTTFGPTGAVEAGGMISSVGNAESFDVPITRVEFVSPAAQPTAAAIATELGVQATQATTTPAGADVIVVVGADARK